MKQNQLSYVLITPARNESATIERTIKSVVEQTLRPVKYVVVSDGSTDGTDDIVRKFAAQYEWIVFIRTHGGKERNFAGKAHAFRAGYDSIKYLDYNIIGSLDADISFDPGYFAYLMDKFAQNPRLGVGGTPFREGNFQYDYRFTSAEHVSGACQLFRRECFEVIGGYVPIVGGGIDLVAVISARMKGWQTMSFPGKICIHHNKMGSAMHKGLKLHFKWGQSDYRLGGHPVWQIFRCLYQMKNRPYVVAGLFCLAGYYFALIKRNPRSVSKEFSDFRGREQMRRLKGFVTRAISIRKRGVVTGVE